MGGETFILVLCSDCHRVPLVAKPKVGLAKQWDGLLICDECAIRHVAKMRKEWEQVRRIAAGLPPDAPKV